MFLSKIAYRLFTLRKSSRFVDNHTKISQTGGTEFDHSIYKNNFRFKKCFNIASTTDEHINVYLKYHSVGYLTMYYYVFVRLLSLRHIQMHKFTLFLMQAFPNV